MLMTRKSMLSIPGRPGRINKTANHVATMDRDWTQTVCERCYGLLIHEHREKAKNATASKGRRELAKQQPTAKNERRQQEKAKNERRQLERERQELQRQLPGLDSLLAFFVAAGVRVELGRSRCLWINGAQAEPLAHLPPPETLEWNSIVSEIALKYLRSKFIRAVQDNARFADGVRVVLLRRERGFAIMRGDVRLAVIHAARAHIPHREVIRANFLMPGPHWRLLADVVAGAEAELVTEGKRQEEAKAAAEAAEVRTVATLTRAAARRIDHLPDGLDPELIDACLDASRRIRVERQVAYERPVVLECEVGELTLLPIVRTGSRLLMPFRLSKGMETLNGELVISDRDPLPLLIGEGVADEDAITAWTCALLGFADATCIELEHVAPATRRDPTVSRPRPPSSVARPSASTRTLPRGRPWPSHLEPVGHWLRYSGSFVAGHRRRLQDSQTANDEAYDRARQVGIILHPHETWVRPHARGVPDRIQMRFVWHPPAKLKLPIHGPRAKTRIRLDDIPD